MMHHRVTRREYLDYVKGAYDYAISNNLTFEECLDEYDQWVTRINGVPNAWIVDDEEIEKYYVLK